MRAPSATNNPFHTTAAGYDQHLSRPFISRIRRQEAQAVRELISAHAGPGDTALEVGPGTGFYTMMLAERVRRVTAIEDSRTMAEILSRRLEAEGVENVSVRHADFLTFADDEAFDVVMAIGVLDYIPEPVAFVTRMCELARKAVILTVPQRGLWGACFAVSNRLRGISVFCYRDASVAKWAPGWRCAVTEAGLKTPLTRGLTLVAALERESRV